MRAAAEISTADRAWLAAKMLRAQAALVARGHASTLTADQFARLADVMETAGEEAREMDRLAGEAAA